MIVYGYDKKDRVCVYVRSHLHFPSESDDDTLKKYVIWMIENARKTVRKENPMCCLVFDLSEFSISNMV